jgi:type IX secretion system PorP/SprF family membrane protein
MLTILLLLIVLMVKAQDINISQTYAAPLLLNPALTGGYDGNFRISTLYRDQWSGLVGDPFRSFLLSGDARLDFGRRNKTGDHVGVGVLIASDKVNPFDFSTNSITFNGAFHKKLGKGRVNYLSAGIQFGLAQKNFSYENFTFQDQFNGIDDFPFASREDLPANNYAYFDMSIGLNYATSINDDMTFEIGGAAFHLVEPNISFYKDESITGSPLINENALKRRYVAHMSSSIRQNNTTSFTPRLVFSSQGSHQQLMLGSGIRHVFNDVKELALHAGIWGRITHDVDTYAFRDIVTMVGIEFSGVIVGFSYDISIDDISTYSAGQHTFEFSLRYTGNFEEDGYYCPQF